MTCLKKSWGALFAVGLLAGCSGELEDTTDFSDPAALKATSNLSYGINIIDFTNSQYSPPSPSHRVAALSASITSLRALGVTSVRLWLPLLWGVDPLANPKATPALAAAKAYSQAGFQVVMAVVPDHGSERPTYAVAKATFDKLMNVPSITSYVNIFEIGNEPDQAGYWTGTLQQFVDVVLKPAHDSLRAHAGVVIAGPAPSSNSSNVKSLINAGMLNYVDYASFHPYAHSAAQNLADLSAVKSMIGTHKLLCSEWNYRISSYDDAVSSFYKNSANAGKDKPADSESVWQQYAAGEKTLWPNIDKYCDVAHFFGDVVDPRAQGGRNSIFENVAPDAKGKMTPHKYIYDAFAAMGGGSTTPAPVTPTPITTSNVTPKLTQMDVIDTDTNTVIPGGAALAEGKATVISLAALAKQGIRLRHFAVRITPSGNTVGSLKTKYSTAAGTMPAFTKTDDAAPYCSFGDNGTNCAAATATVDSHIFKFTPYASDDDGGTAGVTWGTIVEFEP